MIGSTKDGGYLVPEISKIAESYGLKYFKIDKKNIKDAKVEMTIKDGNIIYENF